MVLKTNETKIVNHGIFSIERFESVMSIAKMTWADINDEVGDNVETMLKNKNRPPMLNVVGKACTALGLANADYVMMKSDDFKFVERKEPVTTISKLNKVSNRDIDTEMLDYYVKESGWSYISIASLLTLSKVSEGISFFNDDKRCISLNDLNTLCWAIRCKPNDICYSADNNSKIPSRVMNKNQIYLLNTNALICLEGIDKILETAHVPLWFINTNQRVYVSSELLDIIHMAILQVNKINMTFEDLCSNSDEVPHIEFKRCGALRHNTYHIYTKEEKENMVSLLKSGRTYKEVSTTLNVPISTLCRVMKDKKREENTVSKIIENKISTKQEEKAEEIVEMMPETEIKTNEEAKDKKHKHYNNRNYKESYKDALTMDRVLKYLECLTDDQLINMKAYIDVTMQRRAIMNKF